MAARDIVVIGGSAGSIEPLKAIVKKLPSGFPAAVFVVVHVSADSPTMLSRLLNRPGLPAIGAVDHEQIQRGHVYVASPDHHLTIEDGRIRALRGPRENRHRPAIDPLFRTAARAYGPRVVGVVLSGLHDDGSAGLYAIRQLGGITVVQDPADAEWDNMPRNAIEYVHPHYVLNADEIAPLLIELAKESEGETEVLMTKKRSTIPASNGDNHGRDNHGRKSTSRAGGSKIKSAKAGVDKPDANKNVAYPAEGEGAPSVFACPECHGVLWELKDDKMVRFRCRTGHSYGIESLEEELSGATEAALWAAVRALEEKSALQRRVAEGMGLARNMASRLIDQSTADAGNARLIRDMIFGHDAELDLGPGQKKEAHSNESLESKESFVSKVKKSA